MDAISRSREHVESRSAARPLLAVAALIAALVACAVLWSFDPATFRLYPACPFYALTGLYCPGCGLLRAAHQLLRGNMAAAFDLNPLALVGLPFALYLGCSQLSLAVRGRALPEPRLGGRVAWGILAVLVAYWVLRNVSYHPFTFLAP